MPGNKGKENQKFQEMLEVRKKLFGEKEGEKMEVTKVIQAAIIGDRGRKYKRVPCNSMEQSGKRS